MSISNRFAEFVFGLTYNALPESVTIEAKRRILDNLGAAVAGCSNWAYHDNLLSACARLGIGDADVIGGSEQRYSIARAAMINTAFAQADELDDGHVYAGVHAGCCVVPAVMVMGSQVGKCGKDIITAVVLGYEIVYRLAVAMCPHLVRKGFHPSSVLDVCGVLAATGKLMDLSIEKLTNGFGLAGLYGAGFMEATVAGQQSKGVMTGNATANGIMAAYLADCGFEGTLSVFEGQAGMFRVMSHDVDPEKVCIGLGTEFIIGDTYSKMYSTCRHAQAAIQAAIDLHKEYGFYWKDIKSIHVDTYQVAKDLTGDIYEPKNQGEAKFSMPYGIALGLIEGNIASYHMKKEYYMDSLYLNLAKRVKIFVDLKLEKMYPEKRCSRVSIVLEDGTTYKNECFDLKGSPNNPIGWDELVEKFSDNSTPLFGYEKAMYLAERIANIENEKNIASLYSEFCK